MVSVEDRGHMSTAVMENVQQELTRTGPRQTSLQPKASTHTRLLLPQKDAGIYFSLPFPLYFRETWLTFLVVLEH